MQHSKILCLSLVAISFILTGCISRGGGDFSSTSDGGGGLSGSGGDGSGDSGGDGSGGGTPVNGGGDGTPVNGGGDGTPVNGGGDGTPVNGGGDGTPVNGGGDGTPGGGDGTPGGGGGVPSESAYITYTAGYSNDLSDRDTTSDVNGELLLARIETTGGNVAFIVGGTTYIPETPVTSLLPQTLIRNGFVSGDNVAHTGLKRAQGGANNKDTTFDYYLGSGDTDYLAGGIWIRGFNSTNYGGGAGSAFFTAEMGAFADVRALALTPAQSAGTATFRGRAIAASLKSTAGTDGISATDGGAARFRFENKTNYGRYDVELSANFGAGTISGVLNNKVEYAPPGAAPLSTSARSNYRMPDIIMLGDATIANDRTSYSGSNITGTPLVGPLSTGDVSSSFRGNWGGVFYGDGATVEGTAGAFGIDRIENLNEGIEASERIVGFFGAEIQ